AASAFYYNWRQAAQSIDYLAADHSDNPVLHYWSLSVEEQFYLAWPLLVFAVLAWSQRPERPRGHIWLVSFVVLLWTASFAYNVHLTSTHGPYAFFGTLSRCWQLLSGALVAMVLVRATPPRSLLSNFLAAASLLMLAAAFIAMPHSLGYPGVVALLPTGA